MLMRMYFLMALQIAAVCCCSAQVAVSEEPMHHKVFENEFVRVLDVHVLPGDTTQFHKHATPSVFIVLHPVKTGSEVIMEEKKATALAKDARISFEGFYTTPRIHRVWNADTIEFHVMDVEILNKQPLTLKKPSLEKAFELLYDEPPVRVYHLTLEAGKEIKIKAPAPFLVVGLDEASSLVQVNKKTFGKKGDYLFIASNETLQFNNEGKQLYSFAVLEFK